MRKMRSVLMTIMVVFCILMSQASLHAATQNLLDISNWDIGRGTAGMNNGLLTVGSSYGDLIRSKQTFHQPMTFTWKGWFPYTALSYHTAGIGQSPLDGSGYPQTNIYGFWTRWEDQSSVFLIYPSVLPSPVVSGATNSNGYFYGEYSLDWKNDTLTYYFNGTQVSQQPFASSDPVYLYFDCYDQQFQIESVSVVNGTTMISPSSADYGDVTLGSVVKKTFSFNNLSTGSRSIGKLAISGGNASSFAIVNDNCSNKTVAENATCTTDVNFLPLTKGAHTAKVTIPVDGSALDATLTGTGIASIIGTVYDLSTGNPLAAASVTLTGGATTQTDPQGNFSFDPAPANGVYTVTIAKAGYGTATINNVIVSDTAGATLKVGMTTAGTMVITTPPPNLPPAAIGTPYSTRVNINGGVGPFTFTVPSGMGLLPPGLTLDASLGSIAGAPTTAGSYSFTINVTDSQGVQAEYEYNINVAAPVTITTASSLPRGTKSIAYVEPIAVSGGTSPYQFSLGSGTPNGLAINSATGIISGFNYQACTAWQYRRVFYWYYDGHYEYRSWTYGYETPCTYSSSYSCSIESACSSYATAEIDPGNYTFTVNVADSLGRSAAKEFNLSVDSPLSHTTSTLNDGIVGTAFNQSLTATGGLAPHTWGVYSGSLPAGLTLDPATGIISGTPTIAGSKVVVISVRDSYNRIIFKEYTFNVLKPMQILTSSMPNGFVSDPYSEQIRLDGGTPPFNYSYTGALPTGLTLSPITGVISGTPVNGGLTNVSITVSDSTYPVAQSKTQNLSIRIWNQLTITSTAVLANARKNSAINSVNLTAKGGVVGSGYSWSLVGGEFPAGITMSGSGIISGTSTVAGDYIVTLRVTDQSATPAIADKQFFIHVSDTLSVATGAVPGAAVGLPYSYTLTANGGLKNYSWAVKTGTLPAGLSLNSNGTISGTPSAKITSSVTIEVTDSDAPAQKAEMAYVFDVSDTLSIYDKVVPEGRANNAYTTNIRAQLGTAPYSWIVKNGALPPGTTLSQNAGVATISGTPTAGGTYVFELEVSDNGTPVQKISRQFTLLINAELAISSAGLKSAVRSTPYSDAVIGTGGVIPYSFNITSGALPTGLVLNSTSGTISGVATSVSGQSSIFTVRVTDNGSPPVFVDKELNIFVIDPLSITTTTFQGALQQSSYGPVTIAAAGGISPYIWSISAGTLPVGITLDPATGTLNGTPSACGSFSFTANVADNTTIPTTFQKAFVLDVTCRDGACGTSNNKIFTTKPTTNLCSNGTATAVGGLGPWSWSCNGIAGGANANCSANIQTYTVTPTVSGASGTVSCISPINHGSNSVCTISAIDGYQLNTFTDNSVDKKSSVLNGSYTISNVILNHSISATFSDSQKPVITAFVLPESGTSLTVAVSTLTATDNVAVTGYLLTEAATTPAADAAGWSGTKPTSYTFATAGSKILYVWARDAAGNVSTALNAPVSVDTTAPTVSAFTIPAASNSLTVPITTYTATDNIAVTGYLLTETATAPAAGVVGWSGTKPTSYTFITAGSKALYAWAKDAAGNVAASQNATVNVDITSPMVSAFTIPVTSNSLTVSVTTYTATDNIAVTGYLLTGTATVPSAAAAGWSGTKPTSYTFSVAGAKTLYAWVKDAAGNVSVAATATITITLPVNGVCGSANNSVFSAVPATNLCTGGMASAVSGSGPWNWSCSGTNGGTTVNCSANIQTYPLTISFAGTGSGSVSDDISCTTGGICLSTLFAVNSVINLIPMADSSSTFTGWSGACTNTSGTCTLTMDSAKTVTATFTAAPKVKVGAKGFSTFQSAYNDTATTTGSVIKLLEGTQTENVTMARNISVFLQGGYFATYSGIGTETSIKGKLLLRSGTVRVKGVNVR